MCVVLAAMDMLNAKPELGFSVHLTVWQTFSWLTVAGLIGVLLAVPLRRHYIDEENLTFADGTAAGEALLVLDQGPKEAGPRVAALGVGMFASGLLAVVRDKLKYVPDALTFGPGGAALRMGSEVSLLSFGSGMLVGPRIAISMGLGMLISWVIAPPMLAARGIIAEQSFNVVLRWVMWPATGFMVAGGVTALILKWKLVAKTFTNLSVRHVDSTDFPLRYVVGGVAGLSGAPVHPAKVFAGISGVADHRVAAAFVPAHAGRHSRAGRDQLGSGQRHGEPDAGGVRVPFAGQHDDQHDRLGNVGHRGHQRRNADAGL